MRFGMRSGEGNLKYRFFRERPDQSNLRFHSFLTGEIASPEQAGYIPSKKTHQR